MTHGKDFIGIGCWGIVTNNQNQILLLKKKVNSYWERPGGKVEIGETLKKSIMREIKEETGIKTKIVDFVMFDETLYGPNKEHWIAFCYHLKPVSGKVKNLEPEKHKEVKWFSFSDLPRNLSPHTKTALKKFLSKK